MGYSMNEGCVRVDIFKPSGKWYETFAVDMREFYRGDIIDALKKGMDKNPDLSERWRGWLDNGGLIVCLEPYHQHSHPICLRGTE